MWSVDDTEIERRAHSLDYWYRSFGSNDLEVVERDAQMEPVNESVVERALGWELIQRLLSRVVF